MDKYRRRKRIKTIILRGDVQYQHASNVIGSLNRTEVWELVIRKHNPKRSRDQSDRYWEMLTRLGNVLGYSKDEMHDLCRFKFLPVKTVVFDGKECQMLKSSTKLSKKEMADYQTQIEAWAASLGIDIWG